MGTTHSRDVDDRRRSDELDRSAKTRTFTSVPSVRQLQDGQVVVIKGTGQIVWRDGDKLYVAAGIESS